MSCILRICGDTVDVESLMSGCSLAADNTWRKGERRTVGRRAHSTSGVSFVASEADLDEFKAQVVDATQFLEENLADISRLAAFTGVEYALLDFGVSLYEDTVAISCHLPPALVRLAARASIGLEVSYYATSDEPEGES
jgi:hypothetical protein